MFGWAALLEGIVRRRLPGTALPGTALRGTALFGRAYDETLAAHPGLAGRRLVHETIRRMINRVVADVITTSAAQIAAAAPRDIDAVRELPRPLVTMSEAVHAEHQELKSFLNEALYRHYRVLRMTNKARRVLKELFAVLLEDPDLLPGEHRAAAAQAEQSGGKAARARVVADYVAGMTDRYAIVEHRRLFNPDARS